MVLIGLTWLVLSLNNLAESTKQVFPEPTVGGLVVNGEGKVLLVTSHKWFDRFTIPGGHIELGETMEDAVKREVREEVGLEVRVMRLLLTQEVIFTPEFWKRKHFIFFDFLCQSRTDRVKLDHREIQGHSWVRPREALKMKLESFTRRVLEKYLEAT